MEKCCSAILNNLADSGKTKLHPWKNKQKHMFKGNSLQVCNTNPQYLSQNSLWIYKRKKIIRLGI
jgi:hypothetical protein